MESLDDEQWREIAIAGGLIEEEEEDQPDVYLLMVEGAQYLNSLRLVSDRWNRIILHRVFPLVAWCDEPLQSNATVALFRNVARLDLPFLKTELSTTGVLQLSRLQYLNITGPTSIDWTFALPMVTNLCWLSIHDESIVGDATMSQLTQLECLRTGYGDAVTGESLTLLTRLHTLGLMRNTSPITVDTLLALPFLTTLDLSCNSCFVPDSIEQLTSLKSLILQGPTTVLNYRLVKLTQLTHLDITGNPQIAITTVNELPLLKQLAIDRACDRSEEEVSALIALKSRGCIITESEDCLCPQCHPYSDLLQPPNNNYRCVTQ